MHGTILVHRDPPAGAQEGLEGGRLVVDRIELVEQGRTCSRESTRSAGSPAPRSRGLALLGARGLLLAWLAGSAAFGSSAGEGGGLSVLLLVLWVPGWSCLP
jgi:hypothetical protein